MLKSKEYFRMKGFRLQVTFTLKNHRSLPTTDALSICVTHARNLTLADLLTASKKWTTQSNTRQSRRTSCVKTVLCEKLVPVKPVARSMGRNRLIGNACIVVLSPHSNASALITCALHVIQSTLIFHLMTVMASTAPWVSLIHQQAPTTNLVSFHLAVEYVAQRKLIY